MRISDWSSDVCSSDLAEPEDHPDHLADGVGAHVHLLLLTERAALGVGQAQGEGVYADRAGLGVEGDGARRVRPEDDLAGCLDADLVARSEEHTSELQSLMRNSYAVFCLKKKKITSHAPTSIRSHQL